MKIDREIVLHIATLARLELTESEIELFTTQLSSIVEYIDQLNRVEAPEAEPFAFSDFLELPLRSDVTVPSLPVERSVANAPDAKDHLFRVPKILP